MAPRVLNIYTDASLRRPGQKEAKSDPAPAGCAWVTNENGEDWEGCFYACGFQTDNYYMEETAIYLALHEYLIRATRVGVFWDDPVKIHVHSDCTSALRPIAEACRGETDLTTVPAVCAEIADFVNILWHQYGIWVDFFYVPSHQGYEGNEEANRLAIRGAELSTQGYTNRGWPTKDTCGRDFTIDLPSGERPLPPRT